MGAINEAVFSLWDTDSNGMIDCIEFFTVMIMFADGRLEDKVRFLFDFYDFNQNGYLDETTLHFLGYTAIAGIVKVFQSDSDMPNIQGSAGEQAYMQYIELISSNFVNN